MEAESFGPEEQPPEAAEAPASAVERLRARHAALQGEHHIDLEIPGYAGDLVGRYRVMSPEEIKEGSRRVAKLPTGEMEIYAAMDQIITSCQGLYVRDPDSQNADATGLVPLAPDDPEPVRFDQRLAVILGFDAKSAREVVRKTFTTGGVLNAPAMIGHAAAIGQWMQDVSPEVDDAFVGE